MGINKLSRIANIGCTTLILIKNDKLHKIDGASLIQNGNLGVNDEIMAYRFLNDQLFFTFCSDNKKWIFVNQESNIICSYKKERWIKNFE